MPEFVAVVEPPFSDRLVTAVFGPGVAALRSAFGGPRREAGLIVLWCS